MSSTSPARLAGSAAEPVPLRDLILADPGAVLEDPVILNALISSQDGIRGRKVVDMRGLAIARLESQLEELQDTHRCVLAAAYDNVAVTSQVHRAILRMVAPMDLDAFLTTLDGPVADILRLRAIRVGVEAGAGLPPLPGPIAALPEAHVEHLVGRPAGARPAIVLRPVPEGDPRLYADTAGEVQSEALFGLDLGADRPPALLALGAGRRDHFAPGQATDLLELFGLLVQRMLRTWLV